jgi:cholesterol transport system auxiliary component
MAGGPGYASKPRPVVIIQDDGFSETLSIAVCPLTSESVEAPILRLLVEPTPGQISYLSDAQWADRLPPLLQARTIEAFENGSRLARVARPGDGVSGDYQLSMDIRTFGVRVEPAGAQAVVEISAKVIGNQAGRIVAARIFTARVPIASVTGPAVAQALDEASDQVLIEMVRWAAPRF